MTILRLIRSVLVWRRKCPNLLWNDETVPIRIGKSGLLIGWNRMAGLNESFLLSNIFWLNWNQKKISVTCMHPKAERVGFKLFEAALLPKKDKDVKGRKSSKQFYTVSWEVCHSILFRIRNDYSGSGFSKAKVFGSFRIRVYNTG